MSTQSAVDCREATQQGASLLMCPVDMVRGKESAFLAAALPMVERADLVLDMSQVDSLDAGGIGTILTLRHIAEGEGNLLVLINPSTRVQQVLQLVGLDAILICSEVHA